MSRHHSIQRLGLIPACWMKPDGFWDSRSHWWPSRLGLERCHHQRSCTWSLEIECHHLGAAQPEAKGVVVGGVHPLSLWVNTGQALLIVFQEVDGFLPDDTVCLGLHKGADFSEVGVFCTQRGRHHLLHLMHFRHACCPRRMRRWSAETRNLRAKRARWLGCSCHNQYGSGPCPPRIPACPLAFTLGSV